jgi:shikimate kinase
MERSRTIWFLEGGSTKVSRAERGDAPSPGERAAGIVAALGSRSIVLVGMMGAGKSSVGRRLSRVLSLPFVDADEEIERAAGKSIPEIFADHGEPYFRSGERRVIARLLESQQKVLATGGGAYMDAATRELIGRRGVAIWLKADVDVLMRRVRRRANRPLLHADDPEAVLRRLLETREPIYRLADLTVQSRDVPHETVVSEVLDALRDHLHVRDALAETRA